MLTLADAVISENIENVRQVLRYGEDINQLDEYGFTPLIEASIVNNISISKLLLDQGANPNGQDVTGGTALHWAAENNNAELCNLLIDRGANPNLYNLAGQPPLVMPVLRQQNDLKNMLVKRGADLVFAQDYINTKLLGHMFELLGTAEIVDPQNQFVEVDFEGFFLEITIGLISDALAQFQNHFAARQLRRYSGLANYIVEIMRHASQLIKYQQYRVDTNKFRSNIEEIIRQEPLLIPVGYEGHAITFVKFGDILVKIDRREDSRLYDHVVFYKSRYPEKISVEFIKSLIYEKTSDKFINEEMNEYLGLTPYTELRVEAQISGNCSWANVEASIPAIFFLVLMEMNKDESAMAYYKTLALNFFTRWREWNKDRALHMCIRSYEEGDSIRKACKAEILAAILFQRCDINNPADKERIDLIVNLLIKSPYSYLLQNYLRVYYYESYTEEGRRFAEMMRMYGFLK